MFQENSIETCIVSRVKQITSPGWMHETSAQTWCTGKTQRDQVEREMGGGIGMGNTCKPMALSFQCMTKSTTIKKKKEKKVIGCQRVPKYFQTSRILCQILPNFIFFFFQQLLPTDSTAVSLVCPLEKLLLPPTDPRV